MKIGTLIRQLALVLAAIGLCLPQMALAANVPTAENITALPPVPAVTDVVLQQGNTLVGQVVTAENTAVPGVEVSLSSANHILAVNKTDQDGRFVFAGLTTGVYEVAVPGGGGVYRVWAAKTAPPAAQPVVRIISQTDVVRSQNGGGLLTSPLLLTGLIATAIAVPVAIHNSGGKSPASN